MSPENVDLIQEIVELGGIAHRQSSQVVKELIRKLRASFPTDRENIFYAIGEHFFYSKAAFQLLRNSPPEEAAKFEMMFTSKTYFVVELEYLQDDCIFEFTKMPNQGKHPAVTAILDIWSGSMCSFLAVPSNPADHIINFWYTGDVFYEKRNLESTL